MSSDRAENVDQLRVVLDVRVSEAWGGVQQAAMGLAHGLSSLPGDGERYLFFAYKGELGWLGAHLGRNSELIALERPSALSRRVEERLWSLGLSTSARLASRAVHRKCERAAVGMMADVAHFTHQFPFHTTTRTIYQPHDLQHAHFPEFFSAAEVKRRDAIYADNCRRSDMIAVMSRWGRSDIVRQYGIEEGKVFVIPWAAPVQISHEPTLGDLYDIVSKYRLPQSFLLYPAQMWPHKNHLRLVRAVKAAHDHGCTDLNVVCTGRMGAESTGIMTEARRLSIADRVRFLGWVPPEAMIGVYRLSRGLIYPSLFEGWGMPLMEAFSVEVPVACSRIPVLEEVAAEAAVYFDPYDIGDIADAIVSLWTDEGLRHRLVDHGQQRSQVLDWPTIAETFRAHYRRLANAPLTDRDRRLLTLSASGEWFGHREG
jgi:glycosyltransferase involved in cell wall biosynthesis